MAALTGCVDMYIYMYLYRAIENTANQNAGKLLNI